MVGSRSHQKQRLVVKSVQLKELIKSSSNRCKITPSNAVRVKLHFLVYLKSFLKIDAVCATRLFLWLK